MVWETDIALSGMGFFFWTLFLVYYDWAMDDGWMDGREGGRRITDDGLVCPWNGWDTRGKGGIVYLGIRRYYVVLVPT